MRHYTWTCDGPNCTREALGVNAEDSWIQLLRPGLFQLRGDSDSLGSPELVFHSEGCLAIWVRTHLIERSS